MSERHNSRSSRLSPIDPYNGRRMSMRTKPSRFDTYDRSPSRFEPPPNRRSRSRSVGRFRDSPPRRRSSEMREPSPSIRMDRRSPRRRSPSPVLRRSPERRRTPEKKCRRQRPGRKERLQMRRSRSPERRDRSPRRSFERNYDDVAVFQNHEVVMENDEERFDGPEEDYEQHFSPPSPPRDLDFQAPQPTFQENITVNVPNEDAAVKFSQDSIPIFDPQTSKLTARQWIVELSNLGTKNKWTAEEKKYYMSLKLAGAAKQWYQATRKVDDDWFTIKRQFYLAFPCDMDYVQLLDNMMKRTKQKEESYAAYFESKMSLLNSCEITGAKAVSCVIGGFLDPNVRGKAFRQNFTDISELYEFVKSEEQHQAKPKQPKHRVRHRNKDCFNCGDKAHPIAKCPVRRHPTLNGEILSKSDTPVLLFGSMGSVPPVDKYFCDVGINGIVFRGYIDFKSEMITVRQETAEICKLSVTPAPIKSVQTFNGSFVTVIGQAQATVCVDQGGAAVTICVVRDDVQCIPVIIGRNFFQQPNVLFAEEENAVHVYNNSDPRLAGFAQGFQPTMQTSKSRNEDSVKIQ